MMWWLRASVVLGVSVGAWAEPWTAWRNSLQPKAEAGRQLTLAVDGVTSYVIVIPETAAPQEEKAARDLA